MAKSNIRTRIKSIAKEAYIDATDEFCDKVEEEIEKTITPEFLEKVRGEIIRKLKPQAPTPTTKTT